MQRHPSPVLLDVTLAYVDYEIDERPSPLSIFLLGRCPSEIHICVDVVAPPEDGAVTAVCRELFAKKEARLTMFYDALRQEPLRRNWDGVLTSDGHTTIGMPRLNTIYAAVFWVCLHSVP